MEDLLIVVVNELIFEDTFALMSPETDKEEFRSNLFSELSGSLNNSIFVLLSNSTDALENS